MSPLEPYASMKRKASSRPRDLARTGLIQQLTGLD